MLNNKEITINDFDIKWSIPDIVKGIIGLVLVLLLLRLLNSIGQFLMTDEDIGWIAKHPFLFRTLFNGLMLFFLIAM